MYRTLVSCCFTPRLTPKCDLDVALHHASLQVIQPRIPKRACSCAWFVNEWGWSRTIQSGNRPEKTQMVPIKVIERHSCQNELQLQSYVTKTTHIVFILYLYAWDSQYICQNLLWLKSGIQINPVSQAGGKALSPVREEREEEDPRLRLKSLE